MEYQVGNIVFLPTTIYDKLPVEGNIIQLYNIDANTTKPTTSHIELEILKITTGTMFLDDELEDEGTKMMLYALKIISVYMQNKDLKLFVAAYDKGGKDNKLDNISTKYRIFGHDIKDKHNLHDTVTYGIFRSNLYELFSGNEYVIHYPEPIVADVNISKLYQYKLANHIPC